MGGLIEVESRPGGGSRFHFTVAFPVIEAQPVERAVPSPIKGYAGPRRRILVADDQEENRELLRQMLEPLGFDVALAADGREALELARNARPDLVLMDLRMPVMNGFDAAAAIRDVAGLEAVPVIAASASSADLARAEADPGTFARSLRKPFQTEDLLEAIARMLGLTWRHAEEEEGGARGDELASAAFVLPPQQTLEELVGLVRLGKLVRVEQIAADLERRDVRLAPFARRLTDLARSFDEERLVALLQDCLETPQDAVSH
jgi:CheY-like chemotaxis protein